MKARILSSDVWSCVFSVVFYVILFYTPNCGCNLAIDAELKDDLATNNSTWKIDFEFGRENRDDAQGKRM